MKFIELIEYKFAEKCPQGKRGRPMAGSPQEAEKKGVSVCEKQTKDGRTVYYKTGEGAKQDIGWLSNKGRAESKLLPSKNVSSKKLPSWIPEENKKEKPSKRAEIKVEPSDDDDYEKKNGVDVNTISSSDMINAFYNNGFDTLEAADELGVDPFELARNIKKRNIGIDVEWPMGEVYDAWYDNDQDIEKTAEYLGVEPEQIEYVMDIDRQITENVNRVKKEVLRQNVSPSEAIDVLLDAINPFSIVNRLWKNLRSK